TDRKAAVELYELSQLLSSIEQVKKEIEETNRHIEFIKKNIEGANINFLAAFSSSLPLQAVSNNNIPASINSLLIPLFFVLMRAKIQIIFKFISVVHL
ncbi:hypothetical protein EZS27_040652, partial [termite gut metagenome]